MCLHILGRLSSIEKFMMDPPGNTWVHTKCQKKFSQHVNKWFIITETGTLLIFDDLFSNSPTSLFNEQVEGIDNYNGDHSVVSWHNQF